MKVTLLGAAAAIIFGLGVVTSHYLREPETKIEYRDRVVTKKVTERTTTTTPDGAVVERVTEQETKDSKQDVPVNTSQIPYRPDYSVGARWYDMDTPAIEIGYRLLGELWIEGEYDVKRREPSVGLRVAF